MPEIPWVLSGVVTDIDGSTAASGVSIRVVNLRTFDTLTATTESDGSYSVTLTSYEDNDGLYIEARTSISDSMEKFGNAYSDVDTGLAGREVNITLDKRVDLGVVTKILRSPYQDKEERMFSPEFNAKRVVIVGSGKVQVAITRDANDLITSIEENDGVHTKVITFTRDANNLVTAVSERFE